jgi:hypothetical protein
MRKEGLCSSSCLLTEVVCVMLSRKASCPSLDNDVDLIEVLEPAGV